MATIMPFFKQFIAEPPTLWGKLYKYMRPIDPRILRFCELCFEHPPMYAALRYDLQHGTTTAKDWYNEYNEHIKRIVPADRLLVMNVKQGWQPLCDFLGGEVPLYPFPRKNDTAVFQRNADGFGGILNEAANWKIAQYAGAIAVAGLAAGGLAMYRFDVLRMLRSIYRAVYPFVCFPK